MLKRAGLALVSGLLLSLAFEPTAIAYLIPVALAGFALSTHDLPMRRAWVPGLVFGVAFYFTHIYWMSESIGPPAWVGLAGLEALFYALLGAAAGPMSRLRWWPVWLAAAWVTMELWRTGWPYSGMPWGRLSFGVVDTPVTDALTFVGMSGLSFLLALSGFVLAWGVLERERRPRLVAAGVLMLLDDEGTLLRSFVLVLRPVVLLSPGELGAVEDGKLSVLLVVDRVLLRFVDVL